jgi:hypothetical protein
MRELLLMIIVPPVVGLATYAIRRLIWIKTRRDRSNSKADQLDPK